jgi:hypothetical protein
MPVETKEVDKPDTDTTKIGAEGNDAFGAAFGAMAEEVVTDDKTAETQVNKDEGADKVVEKTDADKTVDGGDDADKAKSADATAKTEPGVKEEDKKESDEETYETLKHKHDTLKGMFDKETKTLRDELKKLQEQLAAKQDTPKPEPKDEGKEAEAELAKMFEDDPELKEFASEYDYLSKPLQKLLGKIIVKGKATSGSNATNDTAIQELRQEMHFAIITTAHKDFDELVKPEAEGKPSKLEAFINSYDGSDKDKVVNAFQKGNAQQVIELVDLYKESVKKAEASTVVDEVKKKRDEKLNDLAAVPKKDGAINTNTKKKVETYGDAFNEVASK